MSARLIIAVAAALAVSPAAAQDWNLFSGQSVAATDRCVLEWDLFVQVAEGARDTGEWNVFAARPQSAADPEPPVERVPKLVLLTSDSCAPCRTCKRDIKPKMERGGWPVQIVRFEDDPDLFADLDVQSVPTWLAVRRGKVCGRYTGASEQRLNQMLRTANRRDPQTAPLFPRSESRGPHGI